MSSSSAFTPGPWGLEEDGGDWFITYKLDAEHGPKRLGVVFDYANEFEHENAHLIKAAPDLYNGCNALLGLVQLLAANHETPPALLRILTENHRIAEAERALAKARGEA